MGLRRHRLHGPGGKDYTPSIVALVSKLTGNVDPQKIIDLAPGELNNLPGWTAMNDGEISTLGDYPAYQLGGTWTQNGETKIVAQKTVVIPGPDGLYVLQLNADGLEDQAEIVGAATDVIDAPTPITRFLILHRNARFCRRPTLLFLSAGKRAFRLFLSQAGRAIGLDHARPGPPLHTM